jgi:hypothetical protein
MAAPITLSAPTLEGQLLQLIEEMTNAQLSAVLAAAPGVTVRRVITQNVSDDIAGVKTVSLQIPIAVQITATGTEATAIVVY